MVDTKQIARCPNRCTPPLKQAYYARSAVFIPEKQPGVSEKLFLTQSLIRYAGIDARAILLRTKIPFPLPISRSEES